MHLLVGIPGRTRGCVLLVRRDEVDVELWAVRLGLDDAPADLMPMVIADLVPVRLPRWSG
ncbi:hypothetical protein ACIA8I_39470 [Streptomyces rishiriensis]|uniref:hypothetical protein n=1 Tax=Streptomyces rishiriensis TaxID=68264 RepID=UPI0037A6A7B9